MKDWMIETGAWIIVGLLILSIALMATCVFSLWGNAVCRVVMGIEP